MLHDTAGQHRAHVQLASDSRCVGVLAFVAKSGIARDHAEIRQLRKTIDDAFSYAVTKVFVIRVRADGQGSRIDVRSSSRYGSFDFGSNASRVRTLVDDIDDAIGRQKPEQPAAASKKAKGPAPQSRNR